jgi:DNA (cytosine-5)-methyltransferase 1
MSDVWDGKCSREIGFTLRVGGRGSTISDRRNWDAYNVDGVVRQLGIEQGKKMQGFPPNYEFPVSKTQGIKQLGNSVAIDAVREVSKQMLSHLKTLKPIEENMIETKNKGEWTELLVFVKLLAEQKLFLSDKDLNKKVDSFNLKKVTTRNLDLDFYIIDKSTIQSKNNVTKENKQIDISELLSEKNLNSIKDSIINSKKTFTIPQFNVIQKSLGFDIIKGGTSSQKSDIVLDIQNNEIDKQNEGFGIKSYLGSKPTLLNASGSTNFIFRVDDFDDSKIDEVNKIDTRTKLKDRIIFIEKFGGKFKYIGAEKETMEHNLKISDSLMPNIVGHLLLGFYKKRISSITKIVDEIHRVGDLNKEINYGEKDSLEIKIKRLLIDVLLGFFAGEKWDGNYLANGTIVMKKSGDCIGFHIIDSKSLKDYLFENISLDTPSTTRHRFGKLYKEKDGKLYFKLNLQLRF